ncbi:MAG: hypothetical protein A2Y10_19520 [Planctomycetes bacterium GWF2_41_51]|nr:MAG: hypothetical protein A2Y10_19520 [Planctomycetes bacterium GWF2_41_51]HBG28170.1 DUF547 domain-containing protein [Phycisphaerales bacterium]
MYKWIFIIISLFISVSLIYARTDSNAQSNLNDQNSINEINNSSELLNAAEVEGPNTPQNYISGDAFNLGFTKLLKDYVNQNGYVNYAKLRRFRSELNRAMRDLANVEPEVYITWSRNEKIAFWINAYNLCTLKGIIDNYPISPSRFMLLFYPADSVMHIRGLRDDTFFMIMGIQYTLEEIERDALLGRFEDPRICFAVNYGTISSAALRNEPYVGKVLDEQLDEQVKNYFSRPDGLKIDQPANIVYLSPIFKMYKSHEEVFLKQFGTNKLFREREPVDRAVLNFVKDYVSPSNAQYLKQGTYTIEYLKYNWKLNDLQD